MPNMSPTKVPMPQQDPNVRNKNFEEVATGYTAEMAMEEATGVTISDEDMASLLTAGSIVDYVAAHQG